MLDGRAGADMLYGGAGDDIFAFRRGRGERRRGARFLRQRPAPGGDSLRFTGFGAGATLTQNGATDYWTINYGSTSETIRLVDVTALGAGDYTITLKANGERRRKDDRQSFAVHRQPTVLGLHA